MARASKETARAMKMKRGMGYERVAMVGSRFCYGCKVQLQGPTPGSFSLLVPKFGLSWELSSNFS